jgi:hypothetical protein
VTKTQPVLWLSRWERTCLVLLLLLLLGWGALTVKRGAFLTRRMTDACCFFRAGWVVRTGGPLYDFTEENGWHYIYPPLLAILLVPLADAPEGADRTGLLPYPMLVGIWYVLSLAVLAVGLHWLAGALEARSADPCVRKQRWGCRRWWALRVLPLWACLPAIGHTLMRGQTNLLLLGLLCGATAAMLRGRSWRSGLWLAGAICLKVYPAFLLLIPLWRRDWRAVAGCAVGLVLGLALVPAVVFGVPRTVSYYGQYAHTLLGPALGLGSDDTLASELLDSINNDSQSLSSALHNSLHLDRTTRPASPSLIVQSVALLTGALMTVATLAAAGRRRRGGGPALVLLFGSLTVIMLVICPVCHTHYWALLAPLVMGLLAARWEGRGEVRVGLGLGLLLWVSSATYILCSLPGLEILRDVGLTLYPSLLLWVTATVVLWRHNRAGEALGTLSRAAEMPGLAA